MHSKENAGSWSPFWLRSSTLMAFAIFFSLCAASLIVLNRVIAARNGLSLTLSTNHYVWTYGPTTILVVILALWRQVDYYCKMTQPWREMMDGPTPGHRSVLLDYVSSFQISSCVTAVKFGHYPVAASIATFVVLKSIILASTALFVLAPARHEQYTSVKYLTGFRNPPANHQGVMMGTLPVDQSRFRFADFGASPRPAWSYLQKLNAGTHDHIFNGSYLLSPEFAFDQFASWGDDLKEISTETQVFAPEISCEPATISINSNDISASFNLSSPTCQNRKSLTYDLSICPVDQRDEPHCTPVAQAYALVRVDCSGRLNNVTTSSISLDEASEYDFRYAVAAFNFTNLYEGSNGAYIVQNMSSVLCKLGYSMGTATVTRSLGTATNKVSNFRPGTNSTSKISNFTSLEFSELALAHVEAAVQELVVNANSTVNDYESEATAPLFQLMLAQQKNPGIGLKTFLNQSALNTSVYTVLSGILAEVVLYDVVVNTSSSGQAIAVLLESRLYTRSFAVWTIITGFIITTCLSVLLGYAIKNEKFHQELGTIAVYGALLSTSDATKEFLKGYGNFRTPQIETKLGNAMFEIKSDATDHSLELRPADIESSNMISDESSNEIEKTRPWLPFAARRPVIAATLVLPLMAVGSLEALDQLSLRNHGLIDISSNDSNVLSYSIRYSSTAIMFCIATLFNNLDFTITNLLPFSVLSSGNAIADRSLLMNLLGALPIQSLVKSLRAGLASPVASNIACLAGSVLSVAVSGLWISESSYLVNVPTIGYLENTWDIDWPNRNLTDGGAATTLNIMHHTNSSQNTGIWTDLVLPHIHAAPLRVSGGSSSFDTANYTFIVPTLQPELTCTILPASAIVVKPENATILGGTESAYILKFPPNIHATAELPTGCAANVTLGAEVIQFGDTQIAYEDAWVGQYRDLNGTLPSTAGTSCPSVGIIFGYIGENLITNLTALLCTQQIKKYDMNVTYQGAPDERNLNPNNPPDLVDYSGTYLTNVTSGSASLAYRVQKFFDADLAAISPGHDTLDRFFDHLLNGPYGFARESLAGPNNSNALIEAVTQQYKDYMTLVIDKNFRSSVTSPDSNATKINGQISTKVIRLGIHTPSKLILQILLSCMAIFGSISLFFTNLRGILPRDPNSIVSTMALLADSQMCQRDGGVFPEGAERMSEAELRRALDGYVFSMGWWPVSAARPAQAAQVNEEHEHEDDDSDTRVSGKSPSSISETEYKHIGEGGVDRKGVFGIDVGKASALGFTVSRLSNMRTKFRGKPKREEDGTKGSGMADAWSA